MRVLIVEDEAYLAEAIRDGLRLEAIAGDGDTALELLHVNAYDLEPFQRGTERIRTDEHAGVGLGLAIVHSIVRAHDGTSTSHPAHRRSPRHDSTSRHARAREPSCSQSR